MATTSNQPGQLGVILDGGSTLGLDPAELLARFTAARDEAAFAAIVARHGPMVLATCRRILPNSADADDAFQATFLVFARHARSIRDPDRLAPWLHRVARRVAVQTRALAARRTALEGAKLEVAVAPPPPDDRAELRSVLDEELAQLPEKYRTPLVLCYLEGLTHDEAAGQLSWPVGTVRSRLAGGRDRLRSRLARRGYAPGALAVVFPSTLPTVAVSHFLQAATVRLVFASSSTTAATSAVLLAQGVLTSMFLTKVQTVALATVAVAATLAAGTAGVLAQQQPADPVKPAAAAPTTSSAVSPPLTLTNGLMTPSQLNKSLFEQSEQLAAAQARIKTLEAQLAALGVNTPKSPFGFTFDTVTVQARAEPSTEPSSSAVPAPTTAPDVKSPSAPTLTFATQPAGTSGPAGTTAPKPPTSPYGDSFVMSLTGGKKVLIGSAQRDWVAVVDLATGGRKVVYHAPDAGSKLGCIVGTNTFNGVANIPPRETQAVGLMVEGPWITQGAAFGMDDKWYPVALVEPLVNKKLDPWVESGQVLYPVGRHLYAFSNQAKRWGTLELKEPLRLEKTEYGNMVPPGGMQINQAGVIIPEGDILHMFSTETGQWSQVNFKEAR